jgi:hypothetical protein
LSVLRNYLRVVVALGLAGHRGLTSEEVSDLPLKCIETDCGLDVMSQIDTFVQDVSSEM